MAGDNRLGHIEAAGRRGLVARPATVGLYWLSLRPAHLQFDRQRRDEMETRCVQWLPFAAQINLAP